MAQEKGLHPTAVIVNDSSSTLDELLNEHGLELGSDSYLRWKFNTKQHPRNWNWKRKCFDIGFVMFVEMFQCAMSTTGTAVAQDAIHEYGISKSLGYFTFTSAYLIGEGIGSIFLPPISETYGRKATYASGVLGDCIFSVLVAAVPPTAPGALAAVIIGRGMSGVVGAITSTVGPGSLEDVYTPEHRIWGVFAWTTAGSLGLMLGPIYSAHVVTYLGWRWVYYTTAIVMGICFFFSFFLHESRPSFLLQQKHKIILGKTGNTSLLIHNPDAIESAVGFFTETLWRPLRLLVTEPIVILCSALNAIAFGMIFGLTEGLDIVYRSFGFDTKTASLAFLPLAIGLFFCIPARVLDVRRFRRLEKEGVPITPEAKIKSFAIAVPALAAGLWVFAWTIPPLVPHVSWAVSMLALIPVGFATNDLDAVLAGYIADSYEMYAASAFSSLSMLRSILAAVFPLFTGRMFEALGNNAACSVFAAITTLFCVSPIILLKWGKHLRERSKFAKYSAEMSELSLGSERHSSEKGVVVLANASVVRPSGGEGLESSRSEAVLLPVDEVQLVTGKSNGQEEILIARVV
ncbi:major facilitator superfamily domain-containing protein [Phyllosticta citrichinensis]